MNLLAREAELALRAQIDPHFLFNSLNSISSLTATDPAAARRMCLMLGDFLRDTLRLGIEPHSVERRTRAGRTVPAIERVRLGPRLSVERDTDSRSQMCSAAAPHPAVAKTRWSTAFRTSWTAGRSELPPRAAMPADHLARKPLRSRSATAARQGLRARAASAAWPRISATTASSTSATSRIGSRRSPNPRAHRPRDEHRRHDRAAGRDCGR
jgi:hypothetical protein